MKPLDMEEKAQAAAEAAQLLADEVRAWKLEVRIGLLPRSVTKPGFRALFLARSCKVLEALGVTENPKIKAKCAARVMKGCKPNTHRKSCIFRCYSRTCGWGS